MADSEVRKPRRTRGTPSYRYRNFFALGALAVCSAWGLLLHYSPGGQKLKKLMEEGLLEDSVAIKEKQQMLNMFIAPKSVESLKKILEDESK